MAVLQNDGPSRRVDENQRGDKDENAWPQLHDLRANVGAIIFCAKYNRKPDTRSLFKAFSCVVNPNADELIFSGTKYIAAGIRQATFSRVIGLNSLRVVSVVEGNPSLPRFMPIHVVGNSYQLLHLGHGHSNFDLGEFAARFYSPDDFSGISAIDRGHSFHTWRWR